MVELNTELFCGMKKLKDGIKIDTITIFILSVKEDITLTLVCNNNQGGVKAPHNNKENTMPKTDKYGIEIKVGDFVYIDDYTGMEYGTSAGTIQQIKKIGTKRISFDAGFTNLRSAQFEFITKYTLIDTQKKTETYGTFYFPEFKRTATNDEMYKSVVSKLKKGSDKELSDALIKNETHRYENQLANYQVKNHGHGFSVIWNEKKYSEIITNK